MSRKSGREKAKGGAKSASQPQISLPIDALARVNLGQSFAEYDRILLKPGVFVRTPAINAALDASRSKCFFVGRRGTGKTAITRYLAQQQRTTCLDSGIDRCVN